MLARKLLRQHMLNESQEHEIERLIDTLKSNLFYHGHPINRAEAKNDLKLNVVEPTADQETLMWDLYLQYEEELRLNEPFNPLRELELKLPAPGVQSPLTAQQIVQQMQALAQNGIGLGTVNEQQLVRLAAAMVPLVSGPIAASSNKVTLDPIRGAYIESAARADVFKTDLRLERITLATPAGPQDAIKQEALWQRWEEDN